MRMVKKMVEQINGMNNGGIHEGLRIKVTER